MNDNYQLGKKPYLPPRLVAVAFKVELGSILSGEGSMLSLLPNESYTSVNNDGEGFWGTATQSTGGFSNEGYDQFNSSGENSGWVW